MDQSGASQNLDGKRTKLKTNKLNHVKTMHANSVTLANVLGKREALREQLSDFERKGRKHEQCEQIRKDKPKCSWQTLLKCLLGRDKQSRRPDPRCGNGRCAEQDSNTSTCQEKFGHVLFSATAPLDLADNHGRSDHQGTVDEEEDYGLRWGKYVLHGLSYVTRKMECGSMCGHHDDGVCRNALVCHFRGRHV